MRFLRTAALSLIAVLFALGVTAAPASAAVTVNVSPNTGLIEGEHVTVTASGFTSDASLALVECIGGFSSQDDCDLSTVMFSAADSSGTLLPTDYTVYRQIFPGNDPTGLDCAPSNCVLVVANIANESEIASALLAFDPSGPQPPPPLQITATIDPTGTFDRAGVVTITGTITCNVPADVQLRVGVGQQVGRFLFSGDGFGEVHCDGPTRYSVMAFPSNGLFRGGHAMVKFFFDSITGRPFVSGVVGPATIQLHGGGK